MCNGVLPGTHSKPEAAGKLKSDISKSWVQQARHEHATMAC
jgi:hypothetical protein